MFTRMLTHNEFAEYLRLRARDSIHERYLQACLELASEGYTCLRPPGAAGALLIPQNGMGLTFLGCAEPPVGYTCKELGECEIENGHCVRTIHAEVNAILCAATRGWNPRGSIMYSLLKPCYQCTKVLVAAGVKTVYYGSAAYDEERTRILAEHGGVEFVHIPGVVSYGY